MLRLRICANLNITFHVHSNPEYRKMIFKWLQSDSSCWAFKLESCRCQWQLYLTIVHSCDVLRWSISLEFITSSYIENPRDEIGMEHFHTLSMASPRPSLWCPSPSSPKAKCRPGHAQATLQHLWKALKGTKVTHGSSYGNWLRNKWMNKRWNKSKQRKEGWRWRSKLMQCRWLANSADLEIGHLWHVSAAFNTLRHSPIFSMPGSEKEMESQLSSLDTSLALISILQKE